jgi:hypothetical protein
MSTTTTTRSRVPAGSRRRLPAFGPVEALVSFAAFYVFLDRATPTVVETFTAVLDVSPGAVGFATAALLWFVGVLTVAEQVRRQLVAAGSLAVRPTTDDRWREAVAGWREGVPLPVRAGLYLAVLSVCGTLAAVTFDWAVETGITMIRVVTTLNPALLVPLDAVLLVGFFVVFGLAAKALDRLVVEGLRALVG